MIRFSNMDVDIYTTKQLFPILFFHSQIVDINLSVVIFVVNP